MKRLEDRARATAYAVQQLQALCPSLGKKKIADILARAGLHLGVSTVARFRTDKPQPTHPLPEASSSPSRIVTANHPNHVWHVDLTIVPTQAGSPPTLHSTSAKPKTDLSRRTSMLLGDTRTRLRQENPYRHGRDAGILGYSPRRA
jgi:hypothetical protein